MNSCTAIIPYTPPVAPEEFIRREEEKAIAGTVISERPVSPVRQPSLDIAAIRSVVASFRESFRVASAAYLNGDNIAEALESELAITTACDARPIVVTYGCGPCVAVGGYDSTNKMAFVVHFANAGEVRKSAELIFCNISKLVKTPIRSPIQLHLRGGYEGRSEATVEAIKIWMRQRSKDLPMEIASEDILTSGRERGGKSLSIDSRTGEVSEYNPMSNAKRRDFLKLNVMREGVTLAYPPKNLSSIA